MTRQYSLIYIGIIKEVLDNGWKVYIPKENKEYFCAIKNISDFPENIFNLFEKNKEYKFWLFKNKFTGNQELSYKFLHPEEQIIKHKSIPTASHYNNLKQNLKKQLNNVLIFSDSINNLKIPTFDKLIKKN